jgi:hypothetical protein
VEFVETSIFTKAIDELLSEDDQRELHARLLERPDLGVIVVGGGGIRKLRFGQPSLATGKRGGVRVLYYYQERMQIVYLLLAYTKSRQDGLSRLQLKILRELVKRELS